MKRKIISLIMILTSVSMVFTSCGKKDKDGDTSTPDGDTSTSISDSSTPSNSADLDTSSKDDDSKKDSKDVRDITNDDTIQIDESKMTEKTMAPITFKYDSSLKPLDQGNTSYFYYNEKNFLMVQVTPVGAGTVITDKDVPMFTATIAKSFTEGVWADGKITSDTNKLKVDGNDAWSTTVTAKHTELDEEFKCDVVFFVVDGQMVMVISATQEDTYDTMQTYLNQILKTIKVSK